MKTILTALAIAIALMAQNTNAQNTNATVVEFNTLQNLLTQNNDTTYVINFWATWCRPCVAELPHFVQVARQYQNQHVAFYFISLDFDTDLKTKLLPFLQKKTLPGPVWLLNNTNYNSWINKVNPQWKGSIPATLIRNATTGQQWFETGSLTATQLQKQIELLKQP